MEYEFTRTELLIGKEALDKLERCQVAVFGIGGVGGYAAEALARCGVGDLILVDNDSVSPSNINRQIHAAHSTLGQPKVEVMKQRVLDINPRARVETHQTFYTGEAQFLNPGWNYIIDAIDSVKSKIELIVNTSHLNIPIISSMGAGNKLDPSRFEIADIYETSVCPLARVMRRELKKRGISSLKVVYSKESPVHLLDLEGDYGCPEPDSSAKRPPGSISFVPPAAGLLLASHVIRELIKP
ncbi:MAG: tRNA threonylcarbamoyladenosine dehydratase [Syntrophomonadaceae bacterium]